MPRGSRRPHSVWIERTKVGTRYTYRIRWVDPVTSERMSEGCGPGLRHARKVRDAKVAELHSGLRGAIENHRLSHLRAELDGWLVGKSPTTLKNTLRAVTRMIESCRDCRLRFVTREVIMKYRAALVEHYHLDAATVNKHLRHLKAALGLAVDAGWMTTNPCWRWRGLMLTEPERTIRVVEAEEFDALCEACEQPGVLVLLVLAYYQGLRRQDLVQLRWSAVQLERGELVLTNVPEAGELKKSRKVRTMPLRARALEVLRAWWDEVPQRIHRGRLVAKWPHVVTDPHGAPLKEDWLTHHFAKIVERAGIDKCTLHDLRRSFSTLAQRQGLAASDVMALGGWSCEAVVRKHYTGEVSAGHRKMIDRLDSQEKAG